ncbi:hypothetical protein LO762_08340 [Actinocorallia sp. API 0066]|uniref:hypothetical protein n=1 Tax=Actinocorallia sp. API 0066 TaxID=2896846 RepID=UPI001E5992DC|nr:hypothetical protein [Actinocorallia sp. API 0066]MCD0449195.1 hypothetical protein [Actinocorallia sp. API 0066]
MSAVEVDLSRFLRLPVQADDGFPQAFRLSLGTAVYTVALTVTVVEEETLATGRKLVLPEPGAFMVATVTRETPGPPRVVLRRKLVPGLTYEAAELEFVAVSMVVDPRNLGAAGAFGSEVVAGVAARWAL